MRPDRLTYSGSHIVPPEIVTQCFSLAEYELFRETPQFKPIFHLKPFSLISHCTLGELTTHYFSKASLEIDRLLTESEFQEIIPLLEKEVVGKFKSLRIKDLGLAHFLSREYPEQAFQFRIDAGFQNMASIKTLTEVFGKQLEGIIVPPIFSRLDLLSLCEQVNIPIEVEIFGPIRLFFSHRELLPDFKPHSWVDARSEEFNHTDGFKTYPSEYGTLMFYPKYVSWIKKLDELKNMNVSRIRIDRFMNTSTDFFTVFKDLTTDSLSEYEARLCEFFNATTIEGFYGANKTDRRFYQLKSEARQVRDETLLGQVVESKKSEYLVVKAMSDFTDDTAVVFKTPLKEDIRFNLKHQILSSALKPVSQVYEDQIILLPSIKKVTPQSYMYRYMEITGS